MFLTVLPTFIAMNERVVGSWVISSGNDVTNISERLFFG